MLPEEEDFNEHDFYWDVNVEGGEEVVDLPLHLKLELKKQERINNKPRKMRDGHY